MICAVILSMEEAQRLIRFKSRDELREIVLKVMDVSEEGVDVRVRLLHTYSLKEMAWHSWEKLELITPVLQEIFGVWEAGN